MLSVLVGFTAVQAQQEGTLTQETHPPLTTSECDAQGCTTKQNSIVIDANWRWVHQTGQPKNCYTGNLWDSSICPDPVTCTANCAVDGATYASTYGIQTSGNELTLGFVTHGQYGDNIGSRTYLMEDEEHYKMFKLKNREFSFDVDVSNLPCGLNGALYFVSMEEDGGMAQFPTNKAGAKFGTGYCDAQCPHDIKFINGEANSKDWKPNPTDKNAGIGHYGSCCVEMDIWEGNLISTAYTPHPCTVTTQTRCEGVDCGDNDKDERYKGICDKDGCDFNSYRLGDKTFYGPGMTVDTKSKMTVVTQFITSDHTDAGDLVEIRRVYVQNGKVIQNSPITVGGQKFDSVTEGFCAAQKTAFANTNEFKVKGGLKQMGEAFDKGMVLVMSLWDDHDVHMLWLDSDFPADVDPKTPGVSRGTCPTTSGVPEDVEKNFGTSSVKYSNIKTGTIGSTFPSGAPTPGPAPTPASGCPGGSLQACIGLCPSNPPAAYQACVQSCVTRCP